MQNRRPCTAAVQPRPAAALAAMMPACLQPLPLPACSFATLMEVTMGQLEEVSRQQRERPRDRRNRVKQRGMASRHELQGSRDRSKEPAAAATGGAHNASPRVKWYG